jgi:hypothetical protein
VLGGYIAARIAHHDELLNGALASFLCVIFALLAIGSISVMEAVISVIANPVLGFVGGYIRVWQKKQRQEGAGTNIQASGV